jgi:hypothetical protein
METLRPLLEMADEGKYTITVTKRFGLAKAGQR